MLAMELLLAALTGLVAGAAHTFLGPDHLAAVAPLSIDRRTTAAWRVGLCWGAGHAGGAWLLALAAIGARAALPIDVVSAWSERLVGVVLIGIGLWGIRRALATRIHVHEHEHDGQRHAHIHAHSEAHDHGRPHGHAHAHTHAATAIGLLHGLAGASHVVAVLPALAFATIGASVAYLVMFGLGSIAAMTLFAALIASIARRSAGRAGAVHGAIGAACGMAAAVVGVVWLVASSHGPDG
jgi:ABC-type nickel/cobalt efflux system permease component RcnA